MNIVKTMTKLTGNPSINNSSIVSDCSPSTAQWSADIPK